jgi:hypothetical protein
VALDQERVHPQSLLGESSAVKNLPGRYLEKLAQKPDDLSVMRSEIQRLNTVFEFYETTSPFSAIA